MSGEQSTGCAGQETVPPRFSQDKLRLDEARTREEEITPTDMWNHLTGDYKDVPRHFWASGRLDDICCYERAYGFVDSEGNFCIAHSTYNSDCASKIHRKFPTLDLAVETYSWQQFRGQPRQAVTIGDSNMQQRPFCVVMRLRTSLFKKPVEKFIVEKFKKFPTERKEWGLSVFLFADCLPPHGYLDPQITWTEMYQKLRWTDVSMETLAVLYLEHQWSDIRSEYEFLATEALCELFPREISGIIVGYAVGHAPVMNCRALRDIQCSMTDLEFSYFAQVALRRLKLEAGDCEEDSEDEFMEDDSDEEEEVSLPSAFHEVMLLFEKREREKAERQRRAVFSTASGEVLRKLTVEESARGLIEKMEEAQRRIDLENDAMSD